jgi:hypothetical protein
LGCPNTNNIERPNIEPNNEIESRDDLLGRPHIDDTVHQNTKIIDATECRDDLLGRPNMDNKTENGHAKSMSLQPIYNPNYQ